MREFFLDVWYDPLAFADFIENAPQVNNSYCGYGELKPSAKDFRDFRVGTKEEIRSYKCIIDDIICEDKANGIAVDVVGNRPIISRAMSGNPYNMFRAYKTQRQQLNANLCIDMSVDSSISNGTIKEIGERVLATIERLELWGHSLGLMASCGGGIFGDFSCMMAVKIKEIGEPLELTKVCYPLSSPHFLRKFNFYWHTLHKEIRYMPGLGQPLTYHHSNDELSTALSYELNEKTLYLPFTLFRGWSEDRIFTYIKERLMRLDETVFLGDN